MPISKGGFAAFEISAILLLHGAVDVSLRALLSGGFTLIIELLALA